MKKLIMIAVMGGILAGCSTEASRMNACESKGVSRDACYVAEQNRQATINAAAENRLWKTRKTCMAQMIQIPVTTTNTINIKV